MAIKKRNMLCLKKKENLDIGNLLLYNPYKNVLLNFFELATKREAKEFDPVAKVYHGLLSAPEDIRDYYEALLGVTSYYQASKGGRGRYIEKKLASSFNFCSIDIKLSQIPFWLTHPEIHKRKGIFTFQELSPEDKKIIRRFNWDWLGENDVETDLGSKIKEEKTLVLMEIKNQKERANLLKHGKNFTILIRDILKEDWNARKLYDDFISSEGSLESLGNLVSYLLEEHTEKFSEELHPLSHSKEDYLSDVLQFLGAVEA